MVLWKEVRWSNWKLLSLYWDSPSTEINGHDQEDRDHPLQELLVSQLQLVSWLDSVGQIYPESSIDNKWSERDGKIDWPPCFHEETGVGDAEAHVSGPLGEDAETGGEDRIDDNHLTEKQDYKQEFNKSFVEEMKVMKVT